MKKSTFDTKPELTVEEGKVLRINYGVEEKETTIPAMGEEESVARTVYEAYVTRASLPVTYDSVVQAIVEDAYPSDRMQAVVNNYLHDSSDEENLAEYNAMQEWRQYAKDIARAVVYGDNETNIEYVKAKVVEKITEYDASSSVNSFTLNGASVWLDKATRVGLMNSTTIAKSMGSETTTLWLGEVKLEVECDKAIQLLSALEMYALECFNVTAAHKKAVSALESVEEVLAYDYTSGYPDKLNMEV